MTAVITQIDSNTFYLESRGNKMTLSREQDTLGQFWRMSTDNASHRAYRGLGVKEFASLEAVEKHYKSWRGVSLLLAS
jgi:hypothetical protein